MTRLCSLLLTRCVLYNYCLLWLFQCLLLFLDILSLLWTLYKTLFTCFKPGFTCLLHHHNSTCGNAPPSPYAVFKYSNNLVSTHTSQSNDAAHSRVCAKQMWTVFRSDFLVIFSFSIFVIHSRTCWLVLTLQKIIQDQSAESAATMFPVSFVTNV